MDPRLAELYGTNEEQVESVAADELAEKLASADDLDVEGLSDDEAESLAQEILASSASAEEQAEEASEEEEEVSEEAEDGDTEKVAEAQADYLGRVMAHAFTQELRGIDKEAGAGWNSARAGAGKVMSSLKRGGRKAFGKAKEFGGKAKDVATGKQAREGAKAWKHHASEGKASDNLPKAMRHRIGMDKAKKETAKGVAKTVGAYAGAGAAAFGGKKMFGKKKESADVSAFDTLATQRAYEILEANGISIQEQEVEKTSAPEASDERYEQLANAVDSRAWAMLEEAGYTRAEDEATDE